MIVIIIAILAFIIITYLGWYVKKTNKKTEAKEEITQFQFVELDGNNRTYYTDKTSTNTPLILASLTNYKGYMGNNLQNCRANGDKYAIFNSKKGNGYLKKCSAPVQNPNDTQTQVRCENVDVTDLVNLEMDGICECSYYLSNADNKFKPRRGNLCQYDDNTNCNGQGIVDDNGKCTCNDSQEVLGASCNQLQIGNWQIYMATNK